MHVSGASHEMELRDLLGCTEEMLLAAAVAAVAVDFVSAITKLILGLKLLFLFIIFIQ
jgi:hypothetical protein